MRFSSFASKSFPANDASAEASSRRWRAVQILSWVQDHNDWIANGGFDVTEAVEAFVAIDADALVTRDGGAGLVGKFVMTHAREGLTVAAMEAALACLNATQVIPRTLVDPSVRAAAEREGGGGVGRGGGWTSDDEEEDDDEEDDGGAAVKDFAGDAGEEVVYGSRLHTPPVVAKWRGKAMTIAIPRSSGLASGGESEFGRTGSDDEGWTADSGSDGGPAPPLRDSPGVAPVPAALRADGSAGETSSDDEDIPEWERRERALHPELEHVAMRPHTLAYKQAKMNDGSKFCRVSVGAGRLTPAERRQLRGRRRLLWRGKHPHYAAFLCWRRRMVL